jgi:F0F1-type ATP synthase delta subunit
MEKVVSIKVTDIVGSDICVSSEDGHKVYDAIMAAVDRHETARVSFAGVRRLTTAFLNSAIGQLYNVLGAEKISQAVTITDTDQLTDALIKRVSERARSYFSQPREVRDTIDKKVDEE